MLRSQASIGGMGTLVLTLSLPAGVFAAGPAAPPLFSRIGLTPGTTLRFAVVNAADLLPILPPNPCWISLAFVDPDGNRIGDPSSAWVRSGGVLGLDLPARDARLDVRPVVRLFELEAGDCAGATATVQLVSREQATVAVVGGLKPYRWRADVALTPGILSLPIFGVTGFDFTSTLRLHVVNAADVIPGLPPNPCWVELSFRTLTGAVLGTPVRTRLAPGDGASADAAGSFDLQRQELRPMIRIFEGEVGACSGLAAGAEVLETSTQATTAYVSPRQNPGPPNVPAADGR